jgi:hypothetical protein
VGIERKTKVLREIREKKVSLGQTVDHNNVEGMMTQECFEDDAWKDEWILCQTHERRDDVS